MVHVTFSAQIPVSMEMVEKGFGSRSALKLSFLMSGRYVIPNNKNSRHSENLPQQT